MKLNKSIYTHLAVFGIGLAMALVVRRTGDAQSGASSDDGAARAASRHSAYSRDATADARAAGGRDRHAGAGREEKSGRATIAASQRLMAINQMGDTLERQTALLELIKTLAPGDFAALAEQYNSMEHFGNSHSEFSMILRGWAQADPLAALEYTAKQPNSKEQSGIVLSTWAGKDAAAAERWALAHHEGDGPNPWMAAVIRGVAMHDIAHASELAAAMPASRERGEAMDAISRALLMQGKEAAMAYPASIQETHLRAGMVALLADRLLAKDAVGTAAWVASFPDPEVQSRSARKIGEALANTDMTAAKQWVAGLSPEAQSQAALGMIVPMSNQNITDTANWVAKLNGVPGYDRIVEDYVWSCDFRAPEQSAAWISGVADESRRTRLYHQMLGEWSKRDAPAVKNWVASNPVPASVTKRFK